MPKLNRIHPRTSPLHIPGVANGIHDIRLRLHVFPSPDTIRIEHPSRREGRREVRRMDGETFRYEPKCSAKGCGEPAIYKVAAPWSNGTSRELKNYGLACALHEKALLARAQKPRQGLQLVEGETLGAVGLYRLVPELRDAQLDRLPDP